MQELQRLLKQEQPLINDALERFTAELPAGAQAVARHVLAAGGKRLRPFLTLLTGRVLGCRDERLYTLGAAVEMLHAATLLHDDILDHAEMRRGRPAAHVLFEPTTVILAGDSMLAKSMHLVSAFGDTRLTSCIAEAVMRIADGEIAEFALLRRPDLAYQEYLSMITGKTAWLLRASCELSAIFSGADTAMIQAAADFGLELGIAFQIVDDALDFSAGTGKPRGGDIKEGKVTPPLLSYIASLSPDEAGAFRKRFRQGPLTDEEAEAVCAAVCEKNHDLRARDMAAAHLAAAASFAAMFPHSKERAVMEQILEYVLKRDH